MKEKMYIVKTRWGTYEILTEAEYERYLIYG